MAKKTKLLAARVLVTITCCGLKFEPNDVIEASEKVLKPFLEKGEVSTEDEEVAYCVAQGAELVTVNETSEPSNDENQDDDSSKDDSKGNNNDSEK